MAPFVAGAFPAADSKHRGERSGKFGGHASASDAASAFLWRPREGYDLSQQQEEETMAEDTQLVGKTAFVAGASSGINLGIAKRFAAAGANVVLISRSPEKIEAAAKEVSTFGKPAIGIAADVRDYAAVEA